GAIQRSVVLITICLAVGVIVSLGLFRIVMEIPFIWILVPGYVLAILLMWLGDSDFVSIAIDAGGVATGPMTNTFLLALALGVSSSSGDRDPLTYGLGMLGLIALAPILSVTALSFIYKRKSEAI